MSSHFGPLLARAADGALEATVVGSFTQLGYAARRRIFHWADPTPGALSGRTVMVTGGASGLGLEAALGFARLGARVLVLARNAGRAERARQEIIRQTENPSVHVVAADLSRLDQVRRAAADVADRFGELDVVVHNAGTLVHDLQWTEDGLEVTAQTHVVAPFLLTALLLPQLRASNDGRVITVTSGGMYLARLDVDALASPKAEDFDGVRAYARAKRAQVVLTEQWATRAAGHGITFHAMHPGWAASPGLSTALPTFQRLVGPILRTPAEGVDTTLWLATSPRPQASSGGLWLDRRRRGTVRIPGTHTPPGEADRLWRWCLATAGIDDPAAVASTI